MSIPRIDDLELALLIKKAYDTIDAKLHAIIKDPKCYDESMKFHIECGAYSLAMECFGNKSNADQVDFYVFGSNVYGIHSFFCKADSSSNLVVHIGDRACRNSMGFAEDHPQLSPHVDAIEEITEKVFKILSYSEI